MHMRPIVMTHRTPPAFPASLVVVACVALKMPNGLYAMFPREKNERGEGLLSFPGGKLEPMEGIKTCAIRELKEEIGVDVDPNHLECVTFTSALRGETTYVFNLFQASAWKGKMSNEKYLAFVDPFNFDPSRLTYADRILMHNLKVWEIKTMSCFEDDWKVY